MFPLGEFSELFFTSDWSNMRQAFIKKYSASFTANKKRDLSIDFNEETSLRSFVDRKLKSLSSYTSLPFINQMEVVLIDLPNEISNLFLIHDKLTCSKSEILEFCDSIQDLAHSLITTTDEQEKIYPDEQQQIHPDEQQMNEMEVFNYDSELQSDGAESVVSNRSSVGGRERGTVLAKKGGRVYSFNPPNRDSTSDSTELESTYTDDGSQTSAPESEISEPHKMIIDVRAKRQKKSEGKVTKRGRGRPRKNLKTIVEDSEDSVLDYINKEFSDASNSLD